MVFSCNFVQWSIVNTKPPTTIFLLISKIGEEKALILGRMIPDYNISLSISISFSGKKGTGMAGHSLHLNWEPSVCDAWLDVSLVVLEKSLYLSKIESTSDGTVNWLVESFVIDTCKLK